MKKDEAIQLQELFKEFIKVSTNGKRIQASGKRITPGVIKNYRNALLLLAEYENSLPAPCRILPINRASLVIIKREKKYWQQFFTGFRKFLYVEKGYYDNYVAGTFKIVKAVFNYLKNVKGIPIGDFHLLFRVMPQLAEPVVLLPEQVHFLIHDGAFATLLPKCLKRTKDIFVFGCITGLRVSDLMALEQKNLSWHGNDCYLAIYTQKTNTYVKIPLPAYCLDIVQRYKKQNKRYLLPRLANTNINKQLKEIGKLAGWDWTLPKYLTSQGKLVEQRVNGQSWKFYQHLSAHTMRRTAITSLLMLGVDEAVVRRISGHAPGSKEFYRYISLAQSYLDCQVKLAHERLNENPAYYKTRQ
ncbi:MAG: tyrosine-type recombinase/integrase [Bacteroidota bacterium]